jgi:hypothetical protein
VVAAGLAVGLPATITPTCALASPRELQLAIEATYLYRIGQFVTWPAGVFANPTAPLVLCIQGADPFGAALDQLTAEKRVDGRPIQIKRLARLDPASGCHIAYLGGGAAQSQVQALEAVDSTPVVTVTDEARAGAAHGIFHFLQDGLRLRFSADAAQAEQSGVAISSKVLALAVAVKR